MPRLRVVGAFALVIAVSMTVGCGSSSETSDLQSQRALLGRIRACLTDAGLANEEVGISTNSQIQLTAVQVGASAKPLVDVIVLDPGDVDPRQAGVNLGRWTFAREQGLQVTDQVFINTQQFAVAKGALTPEQVFQQIPQHEQIRSCAAA